MGQDDGRLDESKESWKQIEMKLFSQLLYFQEIPINDNDLSFYSLYVGVTVVTVKNFFSSRLEINVYNLFSKVLNYVYNSYLRFCFR